MFWKLCFVNTRGKQLTDISWSFPSKLNNSKILSRQLLLCDFWKLRGDWLLFLIEKCGNCLCDTLIVQNDREIRRKFKDLIYLVEEIAAKIKLQLNFSWLFGLTMGVLTFSCKIYEESVFQTVLSTYIWFPRTNFGSQMQCFKN